MARLSTSLMSHRAPVSPTDGRWQNPSGYRGREAQDRPAGTAHQRQRGALVAPVGRGGLEDCLVREFDDASGRLKFPRSRVDHYPTTDVARGDAAAGVCPN
eukprot:2091038-Pleurochrysis_carterae.AAC.1